MAPNPLVSQACLLDVQDSRQARFTAATMGALMREADAGSPKSSGEWIICDPLTFIAALEPSTVTATRQASCQVELHDSAQRGRSKFVMENDGNVKILQTFNMGRVAEMLEEGLT